MRVAAALIAGLAGLLAQAPQPPKPIHRISPLPRLPVGTATATALPAAAGAQPAELILTLGLELQCGRLGPGPILVTLPAAVRLPVSLARDAVLVNGHPPAGVSLTRHVVALTLPRTSGLTCDVLAPGTMRVVFTQAAGLGNPASPGRYPVWLRTGGVSAVAHLVVS